MKGEAVLCLAEAVLDGFQRSHGRTAGSLPPAVLPLPPPPPNTSTNAPAHPALSPDSSQFTLRPISGTFTTHVYAALILLLYK